MVIYNDGHPFHIGLHAGFHAGMVLVCASFYSCLLGTFWVLEYLLPWLLAWLLPW